MPSNECSDYIAIGRRNWLHSGSHFAASNIGFMYSLLESCKLTFVPSEKINVIEFMRTDVLNRIKETLRKVVPAGGHAFLYGSQARDEARPDSDWDILILLDKLKIEAEDYDNVSYPLVELGWSLNECVSPVLYNLERLDEIPFLPLCTQRKRRGDTIAMSLSAEDITAVVAYRKEKAHATLILSVRMYCLCWNPHVNC